ncbi:unnamed protein product, partial [Cyprideis torosa]
MNIRQPTSAPRVQVEVLSEERLDIEVCKAKLAEVLPQLEAKSAAALADDICEAISSSKRVPRTNYREGYSHEIFKLKREVREAFQLYQNFQIPFFKETYLRCRRELHRSVRLNKQRLKASKIANLIRDTHENGIRALYNSAKSSSTSSSSVTLQQWFTFFSELYQSFEEPRFIAQSSAPTESASLLLSPFTEEEIRAALNHQSSRAVGMNGVSPADLKALGNILAPLGEEVFTFSGDRSKEEILEFSRRLSGPKVRSMTTCEDFRNFVNEQSVVVTFVGDERSGPLWIAFDEIAEEMQDLVYFFQIHPDCIRIPRELGGQPPSVTIVKEGVMSTSFHPPVHLKDVGSETQEKLTEELRNWVHKERFPDFVKVRKALFEVSSNAFPPGALVRFHA